MVPQGPNPLYVAAVATAALLLALSVAFLSDTTSTPGSAAGASVRPEGLASLGPAVESAEPGHSSRESSASRGTARTTPPTPRAGVVRATHSPAPDHDRAGEATVAPSQGLGAGDLPPLLLLIRDHESGGNYRAYNPTGCSDESGVWSCGGAFQLSEQYASGWAVEAGFPGMSSQAQTWPRSTQDAVALFKFNATDGQLWCAYTEYC